MKLMVTGAHGMLGQAVVAAARERGHDVDALGRADLDVTDAGAVAERLRGAAVVHCAAYTDVDGAECDEERATQINAAGAGHVARAAEHVVAVSTDYVFSGERTGPDAPAYLERDEPAPRSAYGRSKLAGEHAILGASPRHAVVRTAWLFGAGGANFVDTMLRLGRERDEVSVVVDQVGSPTYTGHLAPVLVDLAARRGAGLFHAAGAGRCSWHALAGEAFRVAGLATPIHETTAAQFVRPAPRPPFSVLATERDDGARLPAWQDGVREHLARARAAA